MSEQMTAFSSNIASPTLTNKQSLEMPEISSAMGRNSNMSSFD